MTPVWVLALAVLLDALKILAPVLWVSGFCLLCYLAAKR